MGKRIIIYFAISLAMGGLYYLITSNIIFAIIVCLIYLAICLILIDRKVKKFNVCRRKTKECVSFVNNFIITLSVNKSISTTLSSIQGGFSDELNDQLSVISHLNDEEKIFYLENYFYTPMYKVFLNLLKQYLYEGSDIIDSTRLLIFDLQIINEQIDSFVSVSRNKIFQFGYMWLICFGILVATRFFLGEYYDKIRQMNYYPYAIFGFFMVFAVCMILILLHAFDLSFISRDDYDGKIEKKM